MADPGHSLAQAHWHIQMIAYSSNLIFCECMFVLFSVDLFQFFGLFLD